MSNAVNQAIMDAITGQQKQAANNPFTTFGGAIASQMGATNRLSGTERAILAGLAGFGGGFGQAQADKDMDLLVGRVAEAMQSPDPVAAFEADPELSKYANRLKIAQVADKQSIAAEEAKAQREMYEKSLLNPTEIKIGDEVVTQRYNPESKQMEEISRAGRYRPGSTTNVSVNTGEAPSWLANKAIPADLKKQVIQAPAMLNEMGRLASEYEALPYGEDVADRVVFQLWRGVKATDEGKLDNQTQVMVKNIQKALEGARPSDYDAKTYERILKGDKTVSPKDVATLIRQAQGIFARQQQSNVETIKRLEQGPDAAAGLFDQYVGQAPAPQAPQSLAESPIPTAQDFDLSTPEGYEAYKQSIKQQMRQSR